ncbi:uncharacterized protein LOC109716428 [Ananas comosus]|uniref:Uncharacterized protein LOC109716428 n=1 Tax=Ananas comosus TaxID=4615 RepID=A0A6P5FP55_ANACO|nr:uncharacterized protein LOC109716428 [Ananas comosus]XP_020097458.1 uncharacterized protein LOC109716428 [Ananas comosus]XP_020097459.1 uncharacterized protein LOC109716428 [Ananas comosus]
MMTHAKSESDVTSLAASSPPRSPKRGAVYYVQSPSRDSHDDGDKSSSMHATPVYNNSPMESPSHPSSFAGRHSRASSVSRFSGNLRSGSGRKAAGRGKRGGGGGGGVGLVNEKGWPECDVIEEEGPYDGLDDDRGISRRCQIALGFLSFVLLFTVFCLIIWGAARPYKPNIVVKSLEMSNFYAGEGTDHTGVPTKMVTVNCTLKINVYNSAAMFGIHVSSSPVQLIFSEITIATGELKKYYQPRKSHRTVSVVIHGEKVPLYGAGAGLALSSTGSTVPLTLDFDITSRGYVVGKLVRVTHRKHVTCSFTIDSKNTKPIKISRNLCSFA